MKQIIDGKVYNTKTAEYLGECHYSQPWDFNYISEDLYRTKKGTFFLYGEGGPHSKYCTYGANGSWGGGCKITILTETEAKEWVENNLSADRYIAIFGEPEEG